MKTTINLFGCLVLLFSLGACEVDEIKSADLTNAADLRALLSYELASVAAENIKYFVLPSSPSSPTSPLPQSCVFGWF